MATIFTGTVAQMAANPEVATLFLKEYVPISWHTYIEQYLGDMQDTVEDDTTYDGLELIGDFTMWMVQQELAK
jgi:hypothetical protein